MAEQVLEEGTADIIAMGHQSLADPEWPNKVQAGHLDDVLYCTACNECLNSAVRIPGTCAINPRTCRELNCEIPQPKKKRKILVVGGGPGGMYTATLAAKMGHDVTLWEKSGRLGGLVNAAGAPDFKVDMRRYRDHLIAQLYKNGVNVLFDREGTPESIDAFAPEVVILAIGAETVRPPIPGIDNDKVVTAYDVLANRVPVGDRIVVLGGGHVGIETAIELDNRGKRVTIVEMGGPLIDSADMSANMKLGLKERVNRAHIQVFTHTKMTDIDRDYVLLETQWDSVPIECDNVVLASGFRATHQLEQALQNKPYKVFSIGDCIKPGKVYEAVHGGFDIIQNLDQLMGD